MPPARDRFSVDIALKRFKFNPVLAIQGARQTGKSTLVRELLKKHIPDLVTVSFDREEHRDFAQSNPAAFLERYSSSGPLAIDEAQKVPKIFDEIKAVVDEARRPGRFILLGSTEFSRMSRIREALTGRMARVPVFPMTLRECLQRPNSSAISKQAFFLSDSHETERKVLLNHLDQGGMPGVFSIRSSMEKSAALRDWLELTLRRDIHQFQGTRVDPSLMEKILSLIAKLDEPTAGAFAKETRQDLRRIKTHLQILKELFVICEVDPHPTGSGKPIYYILDVGLVTLLGGSFLRQMETLFVQEHRAKKSFFQFPKEEPRLYYYRSSHGNRVSFVEERGRKTHALQIVVDSRITRKHFYGLESLRELGMDLTVLTPHLSIPLPKAISAKLWECLI